MIFNTGGSNESISAESVKYGDSNVAQALGVLEDIDVSLINSVSALDDELTANNTKIYMDYKDGKYGYNTDPLRGADTFNPFSSGQVAVGNVVWDSNNRQTITCGFKPKQVYLIAFTQFKDSTVIVYDNRVYEDQFFIGFTFGTSLLLRSLRGNETYSLYSINDDGFTLNKSAYSGWTIYYVAVG